MPRMPKPSTTCVCCRREALLAPSYAPQWCTDCRAHIVDGDRLHPPERGFEGRFGAPCPFAPRESAAQSIRCENCGCVLEEPPVENCRLCGHSVAVEAIA